MPEAEARRDAINRFGNRTLAKELTWEADLVGWIESLEKDLRYSVRNLRKNPGFTAVAVLVMALGMGANTAVFTVAVKALR